MKGVVVKLDRGFPLVRCEDGCLLRCEHATAFERSSRVRAVIGDEVQVDLPEGHDKGVIGDIAERRTSFVRRDPADRTASQVLAANFDLVIIAEPVAQLNFKRLERELVLAHETGARVAVVLTKADLLDPADARDVSRKAEDLAGRNVAVRVMSVADEESVGAVRALIEPGTVAVLIGKSGVGKSSLVNVLAGKAVQDVAEVREFDGKGRHTTVDRVMVCIPEGGCVVDMPGVRGLGLWDAEDGIRAAFADVLELAQDCRFRDCRHVDEPGCAVRQAVGCGSLAQARLDSYRELSNELAQVRERRDEARHLRGEKASDRRKARRK